jgi:hypothetical protein
VGALAGFELSDPVGALVAFERAHRGWVYMPLGSVKKAVNANHCTMRKKSPWKIFGTEWLYEIVQQIAKD